jgi:hypothetical protein
MEIAEFHVARGYLLTFSNLATLVKNKFRCPRNARFRGAVS